MIYDFGISWVSENLSYGLLALDIFRQDSPENGVKVLFDGDRSISGSQHPENRDHRPRIRVGTNPRPPILNLQISTFYLPGCPYSSIYPHRLVSGLDGGKHKD